MLCSLFVSGFAFSHAKVESKIASIAEQAKLPGLGVSVVSSKGTEWSTYYGFKKAGGNNKVDAETKWHLGSCTKAITAMAVSRVVEEGKLRFDSNMFELFPSLRIDKSYELITLNQLLSHESGLDANLNWWQFSSRLDAVQDALNSPPSRKVGEYHYSNTGYMVAGTAAEVSTGLPIEELIGRELLAIKIKSLGFGPTGKTQAWPHKNGNPMQDWNIDNSPIMAAAGTVHMTLPDWELLISENLKGFVGKSSTISSAYFKEMLASKPNSYSLGWIVTERDWADGLVLTHAGSNTMNHCVVWIAPKMDRAILVVTNSGGTKESSACDQIVGVVINDFLKVPK